ncbi:MAG TPA: ribonuclease H-like domain-containing protein [Candidatus Methylomirabilis sp.]|nr:ribonuclease H-like domain-containing protein [Candidatus Methylomirabilis sp.]
MSHDLSVPDLNAVIRRIEAKHRPRSPAGGRAASLEATVGGTIEETGAGRVLVVRRRFDLDHRHGRQPLSRAREIAPIPLSLLARTEPDGNAGGRLLYLDTETTGLAGGTGTYAFLVGVGFFEGDGFEVRQYFMRDLDEEPALLAALDAVFRDFDGLVTYNGAGFDLPLLETRFVLARRRWPGDRLHLDLLRSARGLWSARLGDCRLGTLEQHVLRFTREDDVPGAMIPAVYFDYLRRKRPGELPRVFEHNRHDILSLAALTGWVAAALADAPEADHHPDELVGLGRLWEGMDLERGLACYRMALDRGLESPGRERVLLRLAHREKRLARWDEARALWEAATHATSSFDPRPWEEIAKLDEHQRRDFTAARAKVEEALSRAQRHRAPERVVEALEHRLGRLTRRLSARPHHEPALAPGAG